jgi:hypothetical protein
MYVWAAILNTYLIRVQPVYLARVWTGDLSFRNRTATSEGNMPDHDIKPLLEAFVEASRRHQYSGVMEGIGHVAVAVSYAEFTVDTLGWALTGQLDAYLALTKSMALGQKIDRVKDMCKTLITDIELREEGKTFCDNLRKIIERRNNAIHSLYGIDRGDVIRINLRAVAGNRRTVVTPADLFNLSSEIAELASKGASLGQQVAKHRHNKDFLPA